jgi:hypothetical protein
LLSEALGIIGVLIGAASLGYAMWQGSEKRKLEKYVRAQNWHLYAKATNANGSLQKALAEYKSAHSGSLSNDVVEWLARADSFGQDVLKDIVRTIQSAEPIFNEEQVSAWVTSGRVTEHHAKEIFRKITVDG